MTERYLVMNSTEFAEAWKATEKYLKGFLNMLVFSQQERDDILQNTALAAWKKSASFDPAKASFKTWAAGIARFESLNYIRSRKNSKLVYDPELMKSMEDVSVQEEEEIDNIYTNLTESIKKLSPEKIALLKMKYNEKLSFLEIAARLNVSEDAAKVKLCRIRKELKQLLSASNKQIIENM